MSNPTGAWGAADQAAFSHVQDLFVEEKYEDSLVAASNSLARAEETAQSGVQRVLLEIIRHCAAELPPQATDGAVDLSCSFCGRTPPDVRLAAGHSAFICNECVDLLSGALTPAPPPDQG